MKKRNDVIAIAQRVRAGWVRRTGDRLLRGQCHEVSVALARRLRRHGYNARLATGKYASRHPMAAWHCWVEIDGQILDCTATQFNRRLPEVWYPAPTPKYDRWAVEL